MKPPKEFIAFKAAAAQCSEAVYFQSSFLLEKAVEDELARRKYDRPAILKYVNYLIESDLSDDALRRVWNDDGESVFLIGEGARTFFIELRNIILRLDARRS